MKCVTVGLMVLSLVGCTTLRPIEGFSSDLRRDIASGALLKVGDRVQLVTLDGRSHSIAITRLRAGEVVGANESIPIDQIVSVQKRELSLAKAAGAVTAVTLVALAGIAASNQPRHRTCQPGSWFCN